MRITRSIAIRSARSCGSESLAW